MSRKKNKKTKKKQEEQKDRSRKKKGNKKGLFRGRFRTTAAIVFVVLAAAYISFFHVVRGTKITRPSDDQYERALTMLLNGPVSVRSEEDMQKIGTVCWRAVKEAGYSPGVFYVHFLPELDLREKLRHLIHSPFTGLNAIYTDIWLHSCTAYGLRESTWGISRSEVFPANKLSIMILLIDRLKREKSAPSEHFGAYTEIFSGMPVHTLPGRARCWMILIQQCARDARLKTFVKWQLRMRRPETVDPAEAQFWGYMGKQPTLNALEVLADSDCPPASAELSDTVGHEVLFLKLVEELQKKITP